MIIDAFILSDELDMVELRLHELRDVVDLHVVVESTTTFTREPKPLYFTRARKLFADFEGKLFCRIFDPPSGLRVDPFGFEYLQRQELIGGVRAALDREPGDDDLILTSDADEIPRADALAYVSKADPVVALNLRFYETYMDCVLREDCPSVIAYRGSALWGRNLSDDKCDQQTKDPRPFPTIPNGGWHFSGYRGAAGLYAKHTSYGAASPPDHANVDPKRIATICGECRSFVDHSHKKLKVVTLDEHPRYVRENPARWAPFCWKAGRE
jgi:hypothetical protein